MKLLLLLVSAFFMSNAIASRVGDAQGNYGSYIKFISTNADGSVNAQFSCGDSYPSRQPEQKYINSYGGYRYYCRLFTSTHGGFDNTYPQQDSGYSSYYSEAGIPVTDIPVTNIVIPKSSRYGIFDIWVYTATGPYDNMHRDQLMFAKEAVPFPTCNATNLEINFGNIEQHYYDGSVKDGNSTVSCTGSEADITLTFMNPTINLSNNTTAKLTFPDSVDEAKDQFTLDNNSKVVTVRSTLSGVNPSEGAFSGSTTMRLEVQ